MANYTLTNGVDLIPGTSGDDVVSATSATLTPGTPSTSPGAATYSGGDQLAGGAGYDVLQLSGAGTFDLSRLTAFSGFEEVRLTNASTGSAYLTLRDGVDLAVTLGDGTSAPAPYITSNSISVALGTGKVVLHGGNEGDYISASAPGRLRAGDVIDGGAGSDTLSLSYDYSQTSTYTPSTGTFTYTYPDSAYDLTAVSLSHVESLYLSGSGSGRTIAKVDAAALADVTSIQLNSNAELTTTAASLDLTGKSISGYNGSTGVVSQNAAGTTFTVDSAATGLQVLGGAGQDTIIGKGFAFTQAQRDLIFQGSVETITDTSGTYHSNGNSKSAPAVTIALASDTGASSTDGITRSAGLTGGGDAGAVVRFTVDGVAATATATADGAGHWSFTPAGLGDGRHTLVASETDANGRTGSASLAFTLDTTAPTATSTADGADATSTTFTVRTSEAVSGLDAGDFALTKTGSASGTITGVTGDGQIYAVTVSGIAGKGSLALALAPDASVTDAAGNAMTAAGLTASTAHDVGHETVRVAADGSRTIESFAAGASHAATSETYDASWHLVSRTSFDAQGAVTRIQHDSAYGTHAVANYDVPGSAHPSTIDTFDADWHITARAEVDARGHVTTLHHLDRDGSHTIETYAPGATVAARSETYDADWHFVSRSLFDDEGRLTQVQQDNADGTHTFANYDVPGGAHPSTIDSYDADWHITARTQLDASGHATAIDHVGADGGHTVETFALDAKYAGTSETYDAAWHFVSHASYDAAGLVTEMRRDAADGSHAVARYGTPGADHPTTIDRFDADWTITDRVGLDANGAVSAVDHVNADGTHVVDLFRGGSDHAYETDVLGANGALLSTIHPSGSALSGSTLSGAATAFVSQFDASHAAAHADAAGAPPTLADHPAHGAVLAQVFAAGWALV